MTITTKDTNVVILYGDGAVAHFSDLVNSWCEMIAPSQWDSFQFFLAGSEMPELKLDDTAQKVVGNSNTLFYRLAADEDAEGEDQAPDTATYHNIIFDKVKTGNVRLHIMYDSGEKKLSSAWLKDLIHTAVSVGALTTTCMYYLFFGRNSHAAEKAQLADLLKAFPGTTFMLGDTNESGGRVTQEDRLQAAVLAVLMNAAGLIPITHGAYSLGYSALNANGSELRHLSESAACRAITEEISKTVTSLTSELDLDLLPAGAESVSGIYSCLQRYVQENLPQLAPTALRNAWVTIRMNADLSPSEAVNRMKRFADLNYTGEENAVAPAREYAWQAERRIMHQLRGSVQTAAISDSILNEIAEALRRIASEDVRPAGCTFPKKPFSLFRKAEQDEQYLQQCKSAVMKSIREYIVRKNVCIYAAELEKIYRKAADWVRTVRGESESEVRRMTAPELLQDIQKELDSAESGNASKLAVKYRHYADELASLRPKLSVLTEGADAEYFDEKGSLNDRNWYALVRIAGRNMEKLLSAQYRGDFFRVLSAEFSTPEAREQFFDEYLKSGPRMYMNLQAVQSNGVELLLADDRLTDRWFMDKKLYEVKTDNAENLTVYPLGNETAEWYLEADKTVYFLNRETGTAGGASTGRVIFGAYTQSERPEATVQLPRNNLFAKQDNPVEALKESTGKGKPPLRLEPDEKNMYRLYWEWYRNDETAMVEFFQYGERVGKVAVIPVKRFKDNGDNMNVTDEIMGGKPLPAGTLAVTIRDAHHNIIIDSFEVMGRRDVIRYKVSNSKLQLQPEKSGLVEKVVLRTTETDGTQHYFPLYASQEEKPWFFEGLVLSDGIIMEDPTGSGGTVYPVKVD